MDKPIAQLLKEIAKLPETDDKINALHVLMRNPAVARPIAELFKFAFDPRIEFLLPRGKAPYKALEASTDQETRLYREAFKLVAFCQIKTPDGQVVKGNAGLSQSRREQIFLQILESVHPEDAELLVAIKDKRLDITGLTERMIRMAFPGSIYGDKEFFKEGEESEYMKKKRLKKEAEEAKKEGINETV